MGGIGYRFCRGRVRQRHLGSGLSSPLAEPLDLPARVHDPLRPCEERVADGADLGLQLLARGTGRERVPARAGDDRVFVKGGVNLCLQVLLRGVVYRANVTNKLSAWKLITPR